MDEKTEHLREIFVDVTDEETVTESQEESRGSLLDDDRESVEERLTGVIEQLRDRYGFSTDLSNETGSLRRLVIACHDGASDEEIARELGVSPSTVARARLDLHLIRDTDTDGPFDFDAFRKRVTAGEPVEALIDEFDATESTVRHYRRVVEAQDRARRANERYRDTFEEILADADLSRRLADRIREDGLEAATEDVETDVQL